MQPRLRIALGYKNEFYPIGPSFALAGTLFLLTADLLPYDSKMFSTALASMATPILLSLLIPVSGIFLGTSGPEQVPHSSQTLSTESGPTVSEFYTVEVGLDANLDDITWVVRKDNRAFPHR